MDFPRGYRFVLGEVKFFWSLIWHFMDNGTIFQLTTTHKAVVDLLVLGPTVVLPIAVNVLWQGATIVLPSCELCWKCGPCGLRSLQQRLRRKELQLWDSYQLPCSKIVRNQRVCSAKNWTFGLTHSTFLPVHVEVARCHNCSCKCSNFYNIFFARCWLG